MKVEVNFDANQVPDLVDAIALAGVITGIPTTVQIAVGAEQVDGVWVLYPKSVFPSPRQGAASEKPLLQKIGEVRVGQFLAAQVVENGLGNTTQLHADLRGLEDVLRDEYFAPKGVVVFFAEVLASLDGKLVTMWSKPSSDFRFIRLPLGVSVDEAGSVHGLIGKFCNAHRGQKPTLWQWLWQSPSQQRGQTQVA